VIVVGQDGGMDLDHERCYRAVSSRDARFDGTFITAVRTTGIYCRPSCPAMTPRPGNVDFYRTAAAAQRAGFRACRRCRPDAIPGSPEWHVRGDLIGRVMRMVCDGWVERVGVSGVAAALGYSERHLNRLVTDELGAGLLAIARTERAHTARILLEATDLPASEVAWAAGFGSVRSFNDTMAAVYGEPATAVRARRRAPGGGPSATRGSAPEPHGARPGPPGLPTAGTPAPIRVRLAARQPCDPSVALAFLGLRAVPGIETWDGQSYRRSLDLPHRHGVVTCTPAAAGVLAQFQLCDLRDLVPGIARVRRLLDLDADPAAVSDVLRADPMLAGPVAQRPGIRLPGSVDPHETLVRAIAGQQVSVAGARTVVGRAVAAHGRPLDLPDPELTHIFPGVAQLADVDPTTLSMPKSRGTALVDACRAVAEGRLVLDPSVDRTDLDAALQRLRGIGPWTAGYVRMRGLGDPDVMLAGDLGVRHAVAALGGDDRPRAIAERAHAWRPWRSYAVGYLWASLATPDPTMDPSPVTAVEATSDHAAHPLPQPAGGSR
jgi:AraC family transcriptional regulator of adaptative response / DNA-3-methyladenine glycosylase II